MIFFETSPSLGITDVTKIENELNVSFPSDFKAHYLTHNGGYPELDIYTWKDGGKTRINTFSAMRDAGFANLEDTYKDLTIVEKYLPEGIIPFANDDGGNLFCISSRIKDHGSVYYCNNDHYNIENKEECLSLLEKNFTNFLEHLSK